jgi:hypothetical protein
MTEAYTRNRKQLSMFKMRWRHEWTRKLLLGAVVNRGSRFVYFHWRRKELVDRPFPHQYEYVGRKELRFHRGVPGSSLFMCNISENLTDVLRLTFKMGHSGSDLYLYWTSIWLSWVQYFVIFYIPSPKNVEIAPRLGHDRFHTNTFKFIIHQSSFHVRCVSLSYWQRRKRIQERRI